jgi:hypothetical protein
MRCASAAKCRARPAARVCDCHELRRGVSGGVSTNRHEPVTIGDHVQHGHQPALLAVAAEGTLTRIAAPLLCAALALGTGKVSAAVAPPDLSGAWTLNTTASDLPEEAGFDPDWHDSGQSDSGRSGGGGRGGRGGGGTGVGSIKPSFESEEDNRKIHELVAEVTHPPGAMTIAQTATTVTLSDKEGFSRAFYITGKEQTIQLKAGPIGVVTVWNGAQLVIRYLVDKNRELRVTFTRAADAKRLVMTSQFAVKGRGQVIKRVYE